MDNILTVKDIQQKLHINQTAAYQLVKRPDFPKIIIGKKKMICYEHDLEEFLAEHKYGVINI